MNHKINIATVLPMQELTSIIAQILCDIFANVNVDSFSSILEFRKINKIVDLAIIADSELNFIKANDRMAPLFIVVGKDPSTLGRAMRHGCIGYVCQNQMMHLEQVLQEVKALYFTDCYIKDVPIDSIMLAERVKHSVLLHVHHSPSKRLPNTSLLKVVTISNSRLVFINRSQAINPAYIKEIQRECIVLRNGYTLYASRKHLDSIRSIFRH